MMADEILPIEIDTVTSQDQRKTENSVEREKDYTRYIIKSKFLSYSFNNELHSKWLIASATHPLPSSFETLESSTTWILYWTLNSLRLLKANVTDLLPRFETALALVTAPDGVFKGSQLTRPIIAGCYSGINAMISIGTTKAYQCIDRRAIYNFLMSCKFPDGSFEMNKDGSDTDTRSSYCAMTTAIVLNILDENLLKGVAEWLLKCQTYEGGFSGNPGGEAHGGYTYCAVSALALLGRVDEIDIDKLVRWLIQRQMPVEGGFNGRINKLVDVCYTFWQAAVFGVFKKYSKKFQAIDVKPDVEKLLDYVILASQSKDGGFRDKPTKSVDLYHTNYSLSGMSAVLYATNHKMKDQIGQVEPAMGVDLALFKQACDYFKSI
uniref:Protein farnesyltransferase subunit beta n=1 Tax=Entamoeba invadens TaxID=33085 RepID=S0B8K2_ENTIV|nr:protein farnesyltransferase subunit beta, putative [Entamoeba invadens]